MKHIFLTFGDSRLKNSAKRIRKQAFAMNIYDEIIIANECNLDTEFRKFFKDKLIKGIRGFGYWCWKPQIILQTLTNMNDGDILHWQDIGCHLNPKGLPRLKEYFGFVAQSEHGILPFQYEPLRIPLHYNGNEIYDFLEKNWSKGDVFNYFHVTDDDDIFNSEQFSGTVLFIRKCPESLRLIKSWISPYLEDFSIVDDSPSKFRNCDGFIENRHDQSILSILCKLSKIPSLPAHEFEGWWNRTRQDQKIDWEGELNHYPIHNKRDKDFGAIWTFYMKVRNLINRAQVKLFPALPARSIGRW